MDFDKHYAEFYIKSKKNLLHNSDIANYLPFMDVLTEDDKVITPELDSLFLFSVGDKQAIN